MVKRAVISTASGTIRSLQKADGFFRDPTCPSRANSLDIGCQPPQPARISTSNHGQAGSDLNRKRYDQVIAKSRWIFSRSDLPEPGAFFLEALAMNRKWSLRTSGQDGHPYKGDVLSCPKCPELGQVGQTRTLSEMSEMLATAKMTIATTSSKMRFAFRVGLLAYF
jgi:hypothetical protein